ncbi:hypothetical protein WR25_02479 [Diploscapter pachys]|uniref:Uncharacterized protein n=1 Tax=Diploscapter pachys TaxID=2018661 RepID=A0A2A2KCT0_9BILA|nr:hypothetical protein WR25_02479 [Diploscapter pachys]
MDDEGDSEAVGAAAPADGDVGRVGIGDAAFAGDHVARSPDQLLGIVSRLYGQQHHPDHASPLMRAGPIVAGRSRSVNRLRSVVPEQSSAVSRRSRS